MRCDKDGEEMTKTLDEVHVQSHVGLSVLLSIVVHYYCLKCGAQKQINVGYAFNVEAP